MPVNTTGNKLVPKLRFVEFDEEWRISEFKKIADFLAGYAFKSNIMSSKKNTYQIIKMSNVYKDVLDLDRNPSFLNELDLNLNKFKLQSGDSLITLTGTVGKTDYGYSCLILENEKFVLNQRLVRIREIKDKSDYGFVNLLLKTSRFKYYFYNESKGGTGNQTNVGIEDLKSIKINFPTLPEQEKIASFLGAVDQRFTLLQQKKQVLEQYKKGVLQQLFSGVLRFKKEDGTEFPDWEEKKLGEVANRVTTKNKENNTNVLTISAQQGLINQQKYFNKSVSAKDVTGYYLLKKGDFAYNKSYSKGYPMGAIKRLNNYNKGVVSTLYICFRLIDDSSPLFFEQYFDSGYLNQEISKIAQEGARNHGLLNMSVIEFFKDIKIQYPCLEEQEKIASFLSSIDVSINKVAEALEATRQFKKGLLQQMFV